ncbi:MAG TPA: TonB family protein [Bryobacteraceae bacterium]|nr:TonB family protein [Bryobacteraceae bacterium]
MSQRVDILDQPEQLAKPLLGSVALHAGLLVSVLLASWISNRMRDYWGDPNSGGPGSISISVVSKVPLPSRAGVVNPVANDSEFNVPTPPPKAKAQEKTPEPEPDAIPIKSRRAPKKPTYMASGRENFRNRPDQPNQLYSRAGQALVSPMIGQTGSGGVGVGIGSPFGNRFGNYVAVLKQKVAENWHTGDVDARLKTAPPVIVTFAILRDGSVRDVRVAQRSGNSVLDYSAQRAIYDASPFPPLPAGFEGSEARIEFWFELKR